MMVQARGLRVAQGGAAILEIEDLKVDPGETLAVIGPNGAGKSTFLKALALLQRPTGGEILLDGVSVNYRASLLPYRRRLALVMQQPLLRDVSTFENVATGLRFRRTPRREARERAEHWLGRMGIGHLAGRRAATLSGGEAQRASLARALVLNPDLLLLDEPFADLDPPTRDSLLFELRPILREAGATTIFVTPDRDEALRLGDRLAVLIRGRLCQV
ncbi:MAG: ATP-binding cassette domain-containing protein, partial [Dehalococcoidia bacterium]|nr:ATP-binding cassette domain-containing protein [Dehalococcoidia bacterium]